MSNIADKFQKEHSDFLESLGLSAVFTAAEDETVDHSLEFIDENDQKSVVSVQLPSSTSLRGASVAFWHVEKTELEDGWEFQTVDALEYVDTEATPSLNILKALKEHGHEFEPDTVKSQKLLTHSLFIESYKRAKAVLPDASFQPMRTAEGKEGFSIHLNDGNTVLVDVDKGEFNVTFEGNRTRIDNFRGGGADKLAGFLEQVSNANQLEQSRAALDAEVDKWLPSEDCKWSATSAMGTYLEKYALGIDPDDGEISIIRAFKNLDGDAVASVDLRMGFNDFAGEINDEKFKMASMPQRLENAVRAALKGEAVEFVWATHFENDGAFVARTAKVNRAEHVVAGTIEFDGNTPKVVIDLNEPTDGLRPEHVAKPRL